MDNSSFLGKRMIDHLLASKTFSPFFPSAATHLEEFKHRERDARGYLKKAESFEISNIAEYFWNGNQQEYWDVFSDFPCVMPPFNNLWMEYVIPPDRQQWGKRAGILIVTKPLDLKITGPIPEVLAAAKHIQSCTVFIESHPDHALKSIVGPVVSILYHLDALGVPLSHNGTNTLVSPPALFTWFKPHTDTWNAVHNYIYPALLALTFLNCKNTSISEHQPVDDLQKAHLSRHNQPLVKFKTLQIEPLKQLLKNASNEPTGLKRSLHICRGHFKDFRENGLFGRNKGLYWWGAQARGTINKGVVLKDYKLGKISTKENNDE